MIPVDFIGSLIAASKEEILAAMTGKRGWVAHILEIVNELKPSDLFCYLGARFGPPNGVQNLLRQDSSDNLIHWEWTLKHGGGFVSFQGHNFRTEIHLPPEIEWEEVDRAGLLAQIRNDYSSCGREMGEVRKRLEPWVEFVNPYQRIRRAIQKLRQDLDALGLNIESRGAADERPPDLLLIDEPKDQEAAKKQWEDLTSRYSKAFPLCFAIRSMLPVAAESFVNLLMYVLLKPEIKSDKRLMESATRQPIDVRIKSLSINCLGFTKAVDYTSEACRLYHSVVNERNDLLHGNIVIEKLKFNDVYFWGKVPVFREYRSMWQRACGVEAQAVGLERVATEQKIVDDLIDYIVSCLQPGLQPQLRMIAGAHELGLNTETQRLGGLFGPALADFRLRPGRSEAASSSDGTPQHS